MKMSKWTRFGEKANKGTSCGQQQQPLQIVSEENISGLVFSKCIIHAHLTD